jgi:hypothetical protein
MQRRGTMDCRIKSGNDVWEVVMPGLVLGISLRRAVPCHLDWDGRNKSGHDDEKGLLIVV